MTARSLAELTAHADRFVIALGGRRIVGCAELAPLSLCGSRRSGRSPSTNPRGAPESVQCWSTRLADEAGRRARRDGYDKLCAFTHLPGYFIQKGFSIVPHLWIPEKVFTDCVKRPHFQRCGQYAMVLPLEADIADAIGESAVISRHA